MLASQARVYSPKNIKEANELRAQNPKAVCFAGGTDLMVLLSRDIIDPEAFINLQSIEDPEIRSITMEGDKLRIGAMATHHEIAISQLVKTHAPILSEAAASVGARQIQNRGTIGGNIANASPAGDTLPPLLALDAEIELSSINGTRLVPMSELYVGYRKLCARPEEWITAVFIPVFQGEQKMWFRKIGSRRALTISKLSFAGRLVMKDGIVEDARLAFGSVAATSVRARKTEAALVGHAIDPELASMLTEDLHPIDDLRSTAEYRITVAQNVVRTWLKSLI